MLPTQKIVCIRCRKRYAVIPFEQKNCSHCKNKQNIDTIPSEFDTTLLRRPSDDHTTPSEHTLQEIAIEVEQVKERQERQRNKKQKNRVGSVIGSNPSSRNQSTTTSPTHSRKGSRSESPELITFSGRQTPEQKTYRKQVDEEFEVPVFTQTNRPQTVDYEQTYGIAYQPETYNMEGSISSEMFGSIGESQFLKQFPTKEESQNILNISQPLNIKPLPVMSKEDKLGQFSELYSAINKDDESPINPQDENYQSPFASPHFGSIPRQYKRLSITPDAYNFLSQEVQEEAVAKTPDKETIDINEEIEKYVNNRQLDTISEEEELETEETQEQDYREVIDVVLEGEEQKKKIVRRKVNFEKFTKKLKKETGKKLIEFGSKAVDIALSENTQNIVEGLAGIAPGGAIATKIAFGGVRKARQAVQTYQQKKQETSNKNTPIQSEDELDVDEVEMLTNEHRIQEQNYFLTVQQNQDQILNKLEQLLTRRQSVNDKLGATVDIMDNQVEFSADLNGVKMSVDTLNTTQKNFTTAIQASEEKNKTELIDFEKKLTASLDTKMKERAEEARQLLFSEICGEFQNTFTNERRIYEQTVEDKLKNIDLSTAVINVQSPKNNLLTGLCIASILIGAGSLALNALSFFKKVKI